MATLRAIDSDSLRYLVTTLHQTTWDWTASEVANLAQRLGWDNLEIFEGKSAFADARWNVGNEEIECVLNGDRVNRIVMRLTDAAATTGTSGVTFVRDSFADAVATATEVLGPPTSRVPGKRPQVRWRGDDATIVIKHVGTAINLDWANNEWQDQWDQLRGEDE